MAKKNLDEISETFEEENSCLQMDPESTKSPMKTNEDDEKDV